MLDSLVIAATVASQFDRRFRFAAEIAINPPFKNKIFHFRGLEIDPIHSNEPRDSVLIGFLFKNLYR